LLAEAVVHLPEKSFAMILRMTILIVLLACVCISKSQDKTPEPVQNKPLEITEHQLNSIAKNTPVVFSNKGCSRCTIAKTYLKNAEIQYIEVDLGISANRELMYNKVLAFTGKPNIGVAYPVIFYQQEVLYGQEPVKEFLDRLLIAYKTNQKASADEKTQ
jgi:glutaredoxin